MSRRTSPRPRPRGAALAERPPQALGQERGAPLRRGRGIRPGSAGARRRVPWARMSERERGRAAGPVLIGWNEYVDLPEWGVRGLRAKVDTGARSSALHVDDIRELPRGRVRFDVVLHRKKRDRRIRVETRVRRRARVRSSTGHYTWRLFVATRLRLGPVEREIEVSLVDRGPMIFRMLLGWPAPSGSTPRTGRSSAGRTPTATARTCTRSPSSPRSPNGRRPGRRRAGRPEGSAGRSAAPGAAGRLTRRPGRPPRRARPERRPPRTRPAAPRRGGRRWPRGRGRRPRAPAAGWCAR